MTLCVSCGSHPPSDGTAYCSICIANRHRRGLITLPAAVKPAKAKKWGDWGQITGESRVIDHMTSETGMQVKRTKDGSLMIRYRRKG